MGEVTQQDPGSFAPDRADRLFGQIAVDRRFVALHQVTDAVAELARRAAEEPDLRLADVLIKRGHLNRNQRATIEELVERQRGPDRIGRYELVRKIGEGGMGTVYLAKDVAPDGAERVVALKVLPSELARDKTFMGRFQREAQALTRMVHPNIVRGLDVGSADGAHYIAMEFIDGIDCDKMLTRRGRVPEKEAVRIAVQVARALEYAHSQRVIHRDIKPANILVTPDGAAKLTDLGLAKSTSATASKLTQTGITMGTPHYISPEQAMGNRDLDVRSDIYSLGATLYHLVTGRVPFEGSSPAVIVAKHLTEELMNPRDIVPELSEGLLRVLEKMMAKDRDDRYQDPAKLIEDLERIIEDKAPGLEEMAIGKSAIMKAAEFRKAAEKYRARRRERAGAGKSVTMALLGAAHMLGVIVAVAVLVLRSKPGVMDKLLYSDGWMPLLRPAGGEDLPGWGRTGGGAIVFDGEAYIVNGPLVLQTVQEFADYGLRLDVAGTSGADVWLVVGRPAGAPLGGWRVRLPVRGVKEWVSINATVRGEQVTVLADGEEFLEAEAPSGAEEVRGAIAVEFGEGMFRLRNVGYRPVKPPAKTPADLDERP